MLPPVQIEAQIARLIKEDWGRILASLVASLGDFSLAEDCLQDAVIKAMDRWPAAGLPKAPDAWLITVARRGALDRIRRDANFASKAADIAYLAELEASEQGHDAMMQEQSIPDKRLELIFTCCHPSIEEKSRVALTLRALGGLSTAEIAAAFLDKPEAMAARLTRAKAKITAAGIGYKVPDADEIEDRTLAVARVVYLIFNEGFRSNGSDQLMREDLTAEAIRLGRILHALLPDDPQITGLLALMLLGDSRRHARTDVAGNFVPLEFQNRARWDKAKIAEGVGLVKRALSVRPVTSYGLQAAISALHAESADWASTDWAQITALYDRLWHVDPSPVVRVNQAIAWSYVEGPAQALAFLDRVVDPADLARYQPFFAARGDLLARDGQKEAARRAFDQAIALTGAPQERAYLQARKAGLDHLH